MPVGMDIVWTIYLVVVVAIVIALATLVVRLILAATRALNAYTDDRRLRTARDIDEFDPVDGSRTR